MTRLTLGPILPLLALGLGSGACVVPIELVDEADTDPMVDGSGSAGDGVDDGSGSESGEDCPTGALGCSCISTECDAGLACAEGECVPLQGPCGNGMLDAGEDCDDGNLTDADGCNADCRPSGMLLWSQAFDDDVYASGAHAVAIDSADAIVVGGYVMDEITTGWVRKLDPAGTEQWADTFPEEVSCWEMATGPDDRIAAGCSWDGAFGFGSVFVRTYGADGTIEQTIEESWGRTEALAFTSAGSLLAGASTRLFAFDGGPTWYWEHDDSITTMAMASDGSFVVAGYQDLSGTNSWVARYDDATAPGEPSWAQYGPGGVAYGVALDGAGNIVVMGGHWGATPDTWLRKLAPDGSELWSTTLDSGGASGEHGAGLAVDSRDRIVVVGYSTSGPSDDPWIAKLDAVGQPLWSVVLGESEGQLDGVAVDSQDEIVAVGRLDDHAWVARYTP